MSRAGIGIFHPHPTGQTSVTTAREAGHSSSCVPGRRGKRSGKYHGVSATASNNIPNPRVLSARGTDSAGHQKELEVMSIGKLISLCGAAGSAAITTFEST